MSSLEQYVATITNSHLKRRLSELNRLRDRVRQAELSARESRRTDNRKSKSEGTRSKANLPSEK
jgi:hypothetical protein